MNDASVQVVERLFTEVFNARAFHVCDEVVALDYIENATAPFGSGSPGHVDGPAHMRAVVQWLVDQYPDITMDLERVVSDGTMVATIVRSSGTNLGPVNGIIAATGKRFSACQSHWYRVDRGHLAEHWVVRDDLTAMMQLGLLRGRTSSRPPRRSPPRVVVVAHGRHRSGRCSRRMSRARATARSSSALPAGQPALLGAPARRIDLLGADNPRGWGARAQKRISQGERAQNGAAPRGI